MNERAYPEHPRSDMYAYGSGGQVSLGVYWRAIRRRKWLVLFLAALITGAGAGYTYLQEPVYEATALLAFATRSPGAFRAHVGERVTGFVDTQIPLITRETFLSEIARDPELGLARSAMFRNEPDLVRALKRRIEVTRVKRTDIISIRMAGTDPRLVTRTVNRIADLHRTRVENSREASTAAAVQEYTKKMADMSAQRNAIGRRVWSLANRANIPGLTFGEQQKDGRVIVEAFRRRHESLLAQRAEIRGQLDESMAGLAAARIGFEELCKSLVDAAPEREHEGEAAAEGEGGREAGTGGGSKEGEGSADGEAMRIVTAADLASVYEEIGRVEAELSKARALAKAATEKPPYVVALEKRGDAVMSRLDHLRRRIQIQQQTAQQAIEEQAKAQEKVARLTRRMEEIDEALATQREVLTAEAFEEDQRVRLLRNRRATLDAQYEEERAKLTQQMGTLPRILAEGPRIQRLVSGAARLRAAHLTRRVHRENLENVQAAVDAVAGPMTDILNEAAQSERLERAYLRMEDWVREVKLALNQTGVRVYDATEPTVPAQPHWKRNTMAFSGVVGVMVALGVALLLELTRKTVRTPNDVRQALSAPSLGVVPYFRSLNAGSRGVLSLDAFEDANVAETFSEIRFGIHALRGGNPPRTIVVTSATAGEGKSTVSMMLAHSFARAGERVLLIDANTRLPYLHAVFGCDMKPGLGEVLHSRATGQSCLRPTRIPNLYVMPAGEPSGDGLAWLQPLQFDEFVRAVGHTFDRVIFDTTSTLGVADVRVLAGCVDAVIFVVQADRRNRALISRGMETMRTFKANVLGVILNNAGFTKGDHYYFQRRAVDRDGVGTTQGREGTSRLKDDGEGASGVHDGPGREAEGAGFAGGEDEAKTDS